MTDDIPKNAPPPLWAVCWNLRELLTGIIHEERSGLFIHVNLRLWVWRLVASSSFQVQQTLLSVASLKTMPCAYRLPSTFYVTVAGDYYAAVEGRERVSLKWFQQGADRGMGVMEVKREFYS